MKTISKVYAIARVIRRKLSPFFNLIEGFVSVSGFLSALYYVVFSSSFRREQRAVLKGKRDYRKALVNFTNSTSYLLRRNIHRLEKGLIMRPRRPFFAAKYIEETVSAYIQAANNPASLNEQEMSWAGGVLSEYFSVVSDPRISELKEQFLNTSSDVITGPKPYAAETLKPIHISSQDFYDLCVQRRSVRWFEKKAVPRESIDRAVAAAGMAPSACNRQAFRYLIFDAPELVKKVSSIPMGTTGFSENFPAVAVLVGDLGAYFDERDRHVIYIDASLSAMTFMYSLQTDGIGSCSINWPDIPEKEREMRKAIGLEYHHRVIMLIAFGYPLPDGLIPASAKKPIDLLREYNRKSR